MARASAARAIACACSACGLLVRARRTTSASESGVAQARGACAAARTTTSSAKLRAGFGVLLVALRLGTRSLPSAADHAEQYLEAVMHAIGAEGESGSE